MGKRNPETHRNYMRDYMRHRRDEAESKGLCKRCCKRPAESGMVSCRRCLDDRDKYPYR